MEKQVLGGCRILVIEDEYLLADELASELTRAGATIIGPVAAVGAALGLIEADPRLDGALLDVHLEGEMSFPVADLLVQRGVPLVFTTGYDAAAIPARFAHVPRCEKPISLPQIARAIAAAIDLHP